MSGIYDGASSRSPIQKQYLQTASKLVEQGNYEVGAEVTITKEFTDEEYRTLGLPLAQWGNLLWIDKLVNHYLL